MRTTLRVSASVLWCAVMVVGLASPGRADDRRTTEATLNVYRGNPPELVRADVRAALRAASIVRLQEVYPRALSAVRSALVGPWRMFRVGELATLYDSRVWQPRRPAGQRVMPSTTWGPRWLSWRAMTYRPTGAVVRIANVHADPGCTSSTRRYLTDVRTWTRHKLDRAPWPVLLGGDTNCHGWQLGTRYRRDPSGSVDKLATTRGPGVPRTVRRWSVPAFSDHALHLRRLVMP